MSKAWRVVLAVCVIAFLLGGVFVLVGMITGGSIQRITGLFNSYFDIDSIKAGVTDAVSTLLDAIPIG